MKDILKQLRAYLSSVTSGAEDEDFRLRGFWNLDLRFQPSATERLFKYGVAVAQCEHQGACYSSESIRFNESIIGKDARTTITGNRPIDIAVLDAAFSSLKEVGKQTIELHGPAHEKAKRRADLIVGEIERLCDLKLDSKVEKVAVIGAVGAVIRRLRERHMDVIATDLDEDIIGKELAGVRIEDGAENTLRSVRESDAAVVTGMTLATNSMEPILEIAEQTNKPLLVIAETGSWFGRFYTEYLPVDSVIGEPFPFYIFSGTTECHLYSKWK